MCYQIEPILMEAGEPPLKAKVLFCPKIIVGEGNTCQVNGEEAACQLEGWKAPEILTAGISLTMTVKRSDARQAALDITLQDTRIENNNDDGCVIAGNTLRAIRKIEMDKAVQFVLAKDAKGKPQRWVELTVRSVAPPMAFESLPRKPVVAPQPLPHAPAIFPEPLPPQPRK